MDKLILKIYSEFEAKKQAFIDNQLTPIKYMDLYRGQPVAPERFEIFALPAIFFNYNIDWTQSEKGSGLLTLDAHVLIDAGHHTDSVSPNKETGLSIVKYYRFIDYVLRYLESENTSKLKLISENPVETDYYNYHIMQYQAVITDTWVKHPMNEGTIEELVIDKGKPKFIID